MGDAILPFVASGSGSDPSCKFKANSYDLSRSLSYTVSSIANGPVFMILIITQQSKTAGYNTPDTSYSGVGTSVAISSMYALCNTGKAQTIEFGRYSTLKMNASGVATLSCGSSSYSDIYEHPMLACVFYG